MSCLRGIDNILSQKYCMFTSGTEWVPSLGAEDGAPHLHTSGKRSSQGFQRKPREMFLFVRDPL